MVAVVTVVLWLLGHHLVRPLWHGFFDLEVYRGAVQWWAGGHPLYTFERGTTGYGFTYPPFAALALAPLALGPWRLQAWLLSAASVAVVVAVVARLLGPVARRAGWRPAFAVGLAVPVALMMDPVRETIAFGQINLLLAALVLADFLALRRGWRWAGVGIGLATAIKLTPAIFVLYLLLTRRWRPALVAVATFAAASLVALLTSPHTSAQFWTTTLFETSRVGRVDKTTNQSLLGVLARLFGAEPPQVLWLLLAVGVLVVGLWRAVLAHRAGDELVGIVLTGLTGCLISPISWSHHLVWLLPAVIVVVDVGIGRPVARVWPRTRPPGTGRRRVAALSAAAITLACCSSVIWYAARDDGLTHVGGPFGALVENSFALAMVALVVLLPVRAPVTGDGAGPSGERRRALPRPAGSSPR